MTETPRYEKSPLLRRTFLASSVAACSSVFVGQSRGVQPEANAAESPAKPSADRYKICAFVKFLQTLSFDQLAEVVAEMGFDGIEATVRDNGHVLPERVEDDLPKLVEALKKHGLEVNIMASSINRADHPHTEKVLRTASELGITCYRMWYYEYNLDQPVPRQLETFAAKLKDLVAMNREFGMRAVYQNHSGPHYFGAPIWDLHHLIQDYPVNDIGIAFDICHATVEGGLAWPLNFQLAKPHLGAIYIKDFQWKGRHAEVVPLGTGQIDPVFIKQLNKTDFKGPISLHVEYLHKAGVKKNIAALKQDLGTLRRWLGSR